MGELWQLWQATAKRHWRKTVLIEAETRQAWTGGMLLAEASQQAEQLPSHVQGRAIAFSLPNKAEWFTRFLAIQKREAVAVALDTTLMPAAQLRTAEAVGAHFFWHAEGCEPLRSAPSVYRRACYLKLTSGSTGQPKTLSCAASHLIADGHQIQRTMGLRTTDRSLGCIPLGHAYGLGNIVMPLLLQGTLAVTANTFLPREILALIDRYRITVFPSVPSVLRALSQLDHVTKPSSLRLVVSAGGPLTPDVAQEFYRRYGVRIHNFYGATETGGICYDRTGTATLSGRAIGKPLIGVTVRVRRDGRVTVGSGAVATPRRQIVLPDLGCWNADGELQLLGRADMVANIGGRKVIPAEVEGCLRELSGVTDVWVSVFHDARGNDHLAAAVETKLRQADIEQALLGCLPAWKLPKRYFLCAVLPRNERGKIDSAYLRARLSTTLP